MRTRVTLALLAAGALVVTACSSSPSASTSTEAPVESTTSTTAGTTAAPVVTEAPSTTAAVTVPEGVTFPVKEQDEGFAAKRVQEMLLATGYDPTDIDGIYGQYTTKAVKKFQADLNLPETGVVDEELWLALAQAEANAPECSRETLYEALRALGDPSFPIGDFRLANAQACQPGWALATRYVSGTEGQDDYQQDIFLFRVRGEQWQLSNSLERVRTVTNEIAKNPQSELSWYTFNKRFGERGWPVNDNNMLKSDNIAKWIFSEVFDQGLSDLAINDVVEMWWHSSDANSEKAYIDWRRDTNDGREGTLSRCDTLEKYNSSDEPFKVYKTYYQCNWTLPMNDFFYVLLIRGDRFVAALEGPYPID